MGKKLKNYIKLFVLFVLTLLKVIFIDFDLNKIKLFLLAFVAQTKNLINSFCNQNPIKYSYLFRSSKVIANYSEQQLNRLNKVTAELYKTQKKKSGRHYNYSILIPVYKPNLIFFKTLLESCLNQSLEDFEVLLGYDGPQPNNVCEYVSHLLNSDSKIKEKLQVFEFDRGLGGGISVTTDSLAKRAKGDFLLFVDHDDWLRPDLLYRYDLLLRRSSNSEKTVIYCDEFKIDEFNHRIPGSYLRKPDSFSYPYFFVNWVCHCLLVSKKSYLLTGGLKKACDGAQDFDLILKLSAMDSQFLRCPVGLYAWRVHGQSTASSTSVKNYVNDAGIFALNDFVKKNNLSWEIIPGEVDTTYYALPQREEKLSIQVVMPFKDGEELTLKALHSLALQDGVLLQITLIDNNSKNREISKNLKSQFSEKLPLEILEYNEGFNFSRICNFAAKKSIFSKTPYILFMNNDVELDSKAIFEMYRWIEQPKIAAVGCRLFYPNGSLQHGGIDCRDDHPEHQVCWSHTNYQYPVGSKGFHSVQRVVDAVTAACMLIKRSVFDELNGFDEDLFPIAFSDTDLCSRINKLGYYCFYNPLAKGIHHESITREKNAIEDFESSDSIFRMAKNVKPNKSFYYRLD